MLKKFFTSVFLFLIVIGIYFMINSIFSLSVGLVNVIFGDLKNDSVSWFASIYLCLATVLFILSDAFPLSSLYLRPVDILEYILGNKKQINIRPWEWEYYPFYPILPNAIVMAAGSLLLGFSIPNIIYGILILLVPVIIFIAILFREFFGEEDTGILIHASSIGLYFLFGALFFDVINANPKDTWSLFLVFLIVGSVLVSAGTGLYKLIVAISSRKNMGSGNLAISNSQHMEPQRMTEQFNNQIIQMQDDIKRDFNDKMTQIINKLQGVIVVTRLEELRVNTLRNISFAEQQTVKIMLEELLSVQRDLEFMKHLSFEEKKQRFELAQNRVISALQILR